MQKPIGPCKTIKTTDPIGPFLRRIYDISFEVDMKPSKSFSNSVYMLNKLPNFLMIIILLMKIDIKKSIPYLIKKHTSSNHETNQQFRVLKIHTP